MKSLLLLFIGLGCFSWVSESQAQTTYYVSRPSNAGVARYNVVPPPVFRHYEDVRRYNAAPNPNGYKSVRHRGIRYAANYAELTAGQCAPAPGCSTCPPQAVKVRTEVVCRQCQPVATYDACGCRVTRNMTVTLYKDIYSDGRSRIWQHIAYS